MKKLILSFLIVVLLGFFSYTFAGDIPAPFAKAKEMALRIGPDSQGRHILVFDIKSNGESKVYIIGYLPKYGHIGIGILKPFYFVLEFNENNGRFSVVSSDTSIRIFPEDKKVIEEAFKVFRELVAKKLI